MGSSFVAYRGRGFWSSDGYLEHLLALLASEIGPSPNEAWLARARDHWLEQASGNYSAMIDPELDEIAGDDTHCVVVLSILDAVCIRHDATREVIDTAGRLGRLLHGNLRTTESSPLDYMCPDHSRIDAGHPNDDRRTNGSTGARQADFE